MIEKLLAQAAANGDRVRITREDGKTYEGVPVPDPHEPLTYSLRTGKRGRPARVHVDLVEAVEPAA